MDTERTAVCPQLSTYMSASMAQFASGADRILSARGHAHLLSSCPETKFFYTHLRVGIRPDTAVSDATMKGFGDVSGFIPNSYQTPNVYSDKIFHLLTEAELRCVIYMCRRTYGFGKMDGRGRISLQQFITGTVVNGTHVDFGTGLSRNGVIGALARLQEFGLIKKTDDGDEARQIPAEWELNTVERSIRIGSLLERKSTRKSKNSKKGLNFRPSSSDEPRPSSSDEPRPSSSDEPHPVQQMNPLYIETQLETQIQENQIETQGTSESSSSSDLNADQEAGKSKRDDDDDDFKFLVELVCSEFDLLESETLRDAVQDWLVDHPPSHVEASIRKAVLHSPKAPLVYIAAILADSSPRGGKEAVSAGYSIPVDLADIVIG